MVSFTVLNDTYLVVTGSFIAVFISSDDGNIFESPNGNGGPFRDECKLYITRRVGDVDSAAGFIEVYWIAILAVYQFDNIAGWAA